MTGSISRRYLSLLMLGPYGFAMVVAGDVLSWHFFQVLPSLDISIPLSFGYGLAGHSSIDSLKNAGTGSFGIGVSATYRSVWEAKLAFYRVHWRPDSRLLCRSGAASAVLSIQRTFYRARVGWAIIEISLLMRRRGVRGEAKPPSPCKNVSYVSGLNTKGEREVHLPSRELGASALIFFFVRWLGSRWTLSGSGCKFTRPLCF